MKTIKHLILLLSFFFTVLGFSQDPLLQEANEEIELAGKKLTERYTPELVLGAPQISPFEIKIREFLIRKSKVDGMENISIKEKLRLMKKLSRQETAEMRNILTRPQFKKYKRIKSKLQPIYVVID